MYQQKNRRGNQVLYKPKGQPDEEQEQEQNIAPVQPKQEQQQQRQQKYQPRQKQPKVQYVEKGKNQEAEEEWPEEEKKYEEHKQQQRYQTKKQDNYQNYGYNNQRRQYNQRDQNKNYQSNYNRQRKYDKGEPRQREKIDINTPIPELPKKEDILKEPDEVEQNNKLQEIEDKIAELWNKFKEFEEQKWESMGHKKGPEQNRIISELRKIRLEMKKQSQDKKQKLDKLQVAKEQFYDLKSQVEEQKAKVEEFQSKVKKSKNKYDIEQKIAYSKQQLKNAMISNTEEKRLIREIEQLEASLPFAEPMEAAKEELEQVLSEKKKLGKQLYNLTDDYKQAKEKFQDLLNDLSKNEQLLWEERDKVLVQKQQEDGELKKKREETKQQANELKKEKQKVNNEYNNNWDAYEKQQAEIKHIKWMTKQKQYLIQKEKNRLQYEENERKRAEERKLKQQSPYQEEVDLCKLLISYCTQTKETLLGKTQEQQEEEKQKLSPSELQKLIDDKKEWKKENVTVIQNKKEIENDYYTNQPKKPKQKKKPQKKEPSNPNTIPINHKIHVLNDFEQMKLMPPMWASQLDASITSLQEKLAYFEKLNQEGNERDDEFQYQSNGRKKDERYANKETKKQAKKNIAPKFQAEDFPGIGTMPESEQKKNKEQTN